MIDLMKPCHVVPSFFPSCHSQEIANVVTFSRYQMMYNVSSVALKLYVNGTLSYSNKVKNKMKH